jgi:hypothetical protein
LSPPPKTTLPRADLAEVQALGLDRRRHADRRPDRIRQRLGHAHLRAARSQRHGFAEATAMRSDHAPRHTSSCAARSARRRRVRDEAGRRRARRARTSRARARCAPAARGARERGPASAGFAWPSCGESEPATTCGAEDAPALAQLLGSEQLELEPERLHVARVLFEHRRLRLGVADAQWPYGTNSRSSPISSRQPAPHGARAVGERQSARAARPCRRTLPKFVPLAWRPTSSRSSRVTDSDG